MRVDIRNREAFANVGNIVARFPDDVAEAGHEIAGIHAKYLRAGLVEGGPHGSHIHTFKLYDSIKARKRSKYRSEVMMAYYGAYLDNMRPHLVQLKKRRRIFRWAMKKGSADIKDIAARQGCIFVRPHPFMYNATQRTVSKMRSILARKARQSVKRRGKK